MAVYWDITNEHATGIAGVEIITPGRAGSHLVKLSRDFDLILYECFLLDLVGHTGEPAQAVRCLSAIDGFLEGIAGAADPDTTLVMTSDHGNIEDLSTAGHTRNQVPLLALGPDAQWFAATRSILDITPALVSLLSGR